jgi:hypothetical protein
MDTDELAHAPGGGGTSISGCFHSPDVAAHKDRHIACADIFFPDQFHIGSFDHRIGGLDRSNESFGLNHSQSF